MLNTSIEADSNSDSVQQGTANEKEPENWIVRSREVQDTIIFMTHITDLTSGWGCNL